MTGAPLVRFDRADAVATITLDSPANRNALSARLRRELLTHLDAAIADPAVRVIVLTHTGPVFCSGMFPSSRVAGSLKPRVEYRALNFRAGWKKQTTLPSLA